MANIRKQRYDCALNGQGLVLASKPQTPQLLAYQDDVFGQRFAQGDRDYNDLAKWWYMSQTDWSGGLKDTVNWLDDAKYYYGVNVDTFSEPGAVKLAQSIALDKDFTENIICGMYEPVGGVWYVGTDDTGNTKPVVYKKTTAAGSWSDISNGYMSGAQTAVTDIVPHKGKLFYSTIGAGSTYVVYHSSLGGGSETDDSAAIGTACDGITPQNAYCLAEDGATLWAGVAGTSVQNYIVKTVDIGANWVKVLGSTSNNKKYLCLLPFGTNLYYLGLQGGSLTFEVYDGSAVSVIYSFPPQTSIVGLAGTTGSGSRKLLQYKDSKIFITLRDQIWTYTISTGEMTREFLRDTSKETISADAVGSPLATTGITMYPCGAVQHLNRIYWSNLVYNGVFHNNKRDLLNFSTGLILYPVFSDGTVMYWVDNNDQTKLYKDVASTYKGDAGENYVVLGNFDKVAGIDKLAYSIDLIFKTLASGQKIIIEYTTGELTSSTSWTVLGNADFSVDGAITQKTLYFGDAVIYRKIWFRIKLDSTTASPATTTPILYDFVHAYLPMPDYRLRWDLKVKCEDEMQRKDQSKEPKTGVWLRNMLQKSWLTKSILTFEDYDASGYDTVSGSLSATATTITVTGNTDQFPEAGRLLIESEEIFYTGKTKTTFTGCTRGSRGTNKATHADTTAITMGHKVIIRNYKEELIIANQPAKAEYLITLSLSEV